jgi:hypothetical protein
MPWGLDMGRIFTAALVANVAAPFLLFLWGYLSTLPLEGSLSGWEIIIAVIAGMSVLIVLVITFPISLLLALIGWKRGWKSPWTHALCGGGLAMTFYLFLTRFSVTQDDFWAKLLPYAVTGFICGWIYWRLAVAHQKPEADLY